MATPNQPASPSTFHLSIPYHHISDISKQVDKFTEGGIGKFVMLLSILTFT